MKYYSSTRIFRLVVISSSSLGCYRAAAGFCCHSHLQLHHHQQLRQRPTILPTVTRRTFVGFLTTNRSTSSHYSTIRTPFYHYNKQPVVVAVAAMSDSNKNADDGKIPSKKKSSSPPSKRRKSSDATTTRAMSKAGTEESRPAISMSTNSIKDFSTLKVLSLNVAEFQLHCHAPKHFNPRQAFLEELEKHRPGILALQEVPDPDHFEIKDYHCLGTTPSHCGYVGLYVRNDSNIKYKRISSSEIQKWMDPTTTSMMSEEPPVVLSLLKLPNNKIIIMGSCHLEPYKQGEHVRYMQLQGINNCAQHYYENAVSKDISTRISMMALAGDMNMRQNEDTKIESKFGWYDMWKVSGSHNQNKFTWNSKVNQYHPNGYQFTCRFDRIYVHSNMDNNNDSDNGGGKQPPPTTIDVENFQIIANEPRINEATGVPYYLSDHFGILTTLKI